MDLCWCPVCDCHFDSSHDNTLYCSLRCRLADSAPSTASTSPASLPVVDFGGRPRAPSTSVPSHYTHDPDLQNFALDAPCAPPHTGQQQPCFFWTGSINNLTTDTINLATARLWKERGRANTIAHGNAAAHPSAARPS